MKLTVVVPSTRESLVRSFLNAWSVELSSAHILIVEDNSERTFSIRRENVSHYSWRDIAARLKSDSWIFPRRTSCVRSFGFYLAALEQPDMIVSLDDDCVPDPDCPGYLTKHWLKLSNPADPDWPAGEETERRGEPCFGIELWRPAVLNSGLCREAAESGAPGGTRKKRCSEDDTSGGSEIRLGRFPLICPTNAAWRPEVTPALYFLLMGRDYECGGLGNVWAGILFRKIADHLGLAVSSGEPGVVNRRPINHPSRLASDTSLSEVNERFHRAVDQVELTKQSILGCYTELAERLPLAGDYWNNLRRAMRIWAGLFEEAGLSGETSLRRETAVAA